MTAVHLPPFSSLIAAHGRAVYGYLAAAVGPHDAADCYQETMLSALRAYPSLRDASNLRGWLFTIAHRKVVDAARAQQRRPVPVATVPDGLLAGVGAPTDQLGELAELGRFDGERDSSVWGAVRRLPPKQRTAVILRFVRDLPYREIAPIVGCSEAAARQNVRAGLAALRKDGHR